MTQNNNYKNYLRSEIIWTVRIIVPRMWGKCTSLPWGKHEAAKSGEEEPGLKTRMEKINGMEILDDAGRNSVMEGSESGDSWEVLALFDVGVNVKHGKRTFLKLWEYFLLQVFIHSVNAHISCYNKSQPKKKYSSIHKIYKSLHAHNKNHKLSKINLQEVRSSTPDGSTWSAKKNL